MSHFHQHDDDEDAYADTLLVLVKKNKVSQVSISLFFVWSIPSLVFVLCCCCCCVILAVIAAVVIVIPLWKFVAGNLIFSRHFKKNSSATIKPTRHVNLRWCHKQKRRRGVVYKLCNSGSLNSFTLLLPAFDCVSGCGKSWHTTPLYLYIIRGRLSRRFECFYLTKFLNFFFSLQRNFPINGFNCTVASYRIKCGHFEEL